MKIRNFSHKGLKRLHSEDSVKGVPPDTVDKLRKMLAYLDDMESPEELHALKSWKAHSLTGDRKGVEPESHRQPQTDVSHRPGSARDL